MKTLMIATDFSANSSHVANYAYRLAQALEAKLLLCHTLNVPAEVPQSGTVAWPEAVYDDIDRDSKLQLSKMKEDMIATGNIDSYKPEILCIQGPGFVTDVVNTEADRYKADLIIVGAHSNDHLGTWMVGNHSRKMIESAVRPLLLVPIGAKFQPIMRIGFATDLKHINNDLDALKNVVLLARSLSAELILAHIHWDVDDQDYRLVIDALKDGIMTKYGYEKVSVRTVNSKHVANGLNWLIAHAHINLLAMAHHQHGFFDQLFHGSRTQQSAGHMPVPLLVVK
ncbi:universal stress protein [Mucilaginibacter gossypii]|uniref:universal stress protein n=1 Tax=Mucilaginibacter gossypii TaxID=551996 RepID=UPI000DCB4A6C|nr:MULTISPECIES: universal stress protein [Mucilaginibacter]QTE38847.1 universal stress protein [Mucilaginibacter gossypii]RAV55077.1 hypothetical protein DIU36_17890 [Mucilaginibacter rubeus]